SQHVDLVTGALHNVHNVLEEELGLDAISPKRANLTPEIQSAKRFHQSLARRDLLRRRATVFQVEDYRVGVAGRRLRHHLQRMRRTDKFAAPDRNGPIFTGFGPEGTLLFRSRPAF